MDVVGGGGKAAGAALRRLDWREYTRTFQARKRLVMGRSGYAEAAMRKAAIVLGALLAVAGLVWIAQGLNMPFAPRSFMTSDRSWIIFGAVAVVIGGATVSWARRRA
jgi:hypothetical protein